MRVSSRWLGVVCATFLFDGCGPKGRKKEQAPQEPTPTNETESPAKKFTLTFSDDWEHRAWLEKVSKRIRNTGISNDDEMRKLMALDPTEAVRELMSTPLFAETVLDFNLFYMGFKDDKEQRESDRFSRGMDFPSALASAVEFAKGGDYLKLWSYEIPAPLPPLGTAYLPEQSQSPSESSGSGENSESPNLSQAEIRQKVYEKFTSKVGEGIEELSAPELTEEETCAKLEALSLFELFSAGVPSRLAGAATNKFLTHVIDCFVQGKTNPRSLRLKLVEIATLLPRWIELFESLDPDKYKIETLADVRTFDLGSYELGISTAFTQDGFWANLQNSSTNQNRRRAAYVLKRYFCDDLTPVNIVLPEQHGSEEHAASPSCASCHYKLDPMAGFFKNTGLTGLDFSQSEEIFFDDLVRLPLADYVSKWKGHDQNREWNIGYIRSLSDPAKNHYGDNLNDMFSIIRSAPEAKQCLVKRMLEYFVDENQVFDGDFVKDLSDEFTKISATNSSEAFRRTAERIMTSQTFAQRDPISQKCYDFAPGAKNENRPPCEVAAVVQRNCANCHGAAAPAGGLNLENWVLLADGSKSFSHLRDGVQVSREETMQSIIDRLSSSDADYRMPLNQTIKDVERDVLFKWTNDQMSLNLKNAEGN